MAVWSQEEITKGLLAVIAWAGNHAAASRDLKAHGMEITGPALQKWTRTAYHDEYERLREEHAPAMEAQLAAELRDSAAQAIVVQRKAMELALEQLNAGKDRDPAKTAAYASRVTATSVEKLMTLTNRTPREKDVRSAQEIVRSLIGMNVLTALPAGTPAEGDVSDDDGEADDG